ncbi:MAG: pilin [bacterium]|nr:pilin [bacterium]
MKQIRQALYAAFSVALAAAPAVAGAQWGVGKGNAQSSGLPGDTIYGIITRIMNWLLALIGFIGVIGFVIAGILYLTSAGNEEQIETAKKAMLWSIVGVIVALVGFVIIRAVEAMLGGGAGGSQF